ncbi:Fur family transcriptional regulator [Tumebacillus permanentifrigoris]|uniref:Fur family peroxide stress response transcriptional regulator n=1 Tax=Tumebacillus permanentifrigoris TaxID=378543 RepID=A0A316DCG6_9BACL|nr:Fur family transcriptional regulator [Tumebacillus permanentifrigoris]PWK15901.1 Fur family peroxide stress response transcriptional regulator [Tumebacillus permanentifrigoris]
MQRSSFIETLADLKARGVRLTPQRQMILKVLKETHEHPTAEEIYKQVCQEFSGMSMATVYNTLHRLKELGAIKELSYGDMSSRYDGNDTEHAHLVCESCGEVVDVPAPVLPIVTPDTEALGYEVTSFRLEYYGLCSLCRTQVS